MSNGYTNDRGGRIAGLDGLANIVPPPSLLPGVMRRIAEPAPVTLWGWIRKRRRLEFLLSPLDGVVFAFAGVATMALLFGAVRQGEALSTRMPVANPIPLMVPGGGATSEAEATVLVRFVFVAQGARKVAVAGDFNGWDPEGIVLQKQDARGTFVATARVARGSHQYMFVVDGEWVTDPTASERRPDGFGRDNAVLRL